MQARRTLLWAGILSVVTLLSIYTVDGVIAAAVEPFAAQSRTAVHPVMTVIEIAFAFPVSKFATGAVLVAVSLAMFAVRRWRAAAWLVLYVGATHLTVRLLAGVLKNVFLRLRPDEALRGGEWHDRFFVDGGSSFPSGHAAHFWGLFFAVAIAFPKLRIPALILAVFVSVARVIVNDHYLSDVIASAAIAAFVSWGYARYGVKKAMQESAVGHNQATRTAGEYAE